MLEAGLVSTFQIEIALSRQKKSGLKIGQILASYGWIKQQTADFFVEKWPIVLRKPKERPLLFYLFLAGLINHEQLSILKRRQKEINSKVRLHLLAIEQGYLKQETVDFFLRYLFGLNEIQELSFTNLYQLLKNYKEGEVNFQELELSCISSDCVNLTQIILDNSILRQAKLNRSNLSHSSLVHVDLTLADLELANLSHVNFTQACLIEANLRNSNLQEASFQTANLQEADLRGANLYHTSFIAADLRGTKLSPAHNYNVYYSQETIFDANFSPIKTGWILV